jgi:hypothetical protein
MKILMLYTSHRQIEEFKVAQFLYNRNEFLKSIDILFHCNASDVVDEWTTRNHNRKFDKDTVSDIMNGFHSPNIRTVFTDTNSGQHVGVAEQISSVYDQLTGYDFVIHLHPDCFILETDYLQQILQNADKNTTDYIAWELSRTYGMGAGQHRKLEYGSDFFIFTPKEKNNIWKDYKEYWGQEKELIIRFDHEQPIFSQPVKGDGTLAGGKEPWNKHPRCGCEGFMGDQIFQRGLNVTPLDRGEIGYLTSSLEPNGLWHCHNLSAIEKHLNRSFR